MKRFHILYNKDLIGIIIEYAGVSSHYIILDQVLVYYNYSDTKRNQFIKHITWENAAKSGNLKAIKWLHRMTL